MATLKPENGHHNPKDLRRDGKTKLKVDFSSAALILDYITFQRMTVGSKIQMTLFGASYVML